MTRETLESDLKKYQGQLAQLEGDITEARARITQMVANANATKGVTQYLELKLAEMDAIASTPVLDLSKLDEEMGAEMVPLPAASVQE